MDLLRDWLQRALAFVRADEARDFQYGQAAPAWVTLLNIDLDALAESERNRDRDW